MSDSTERATPPEPATPDFGRRTALKTAAAAGIATVVWSEPTIKGLARRPAYAEGASGLPPATVNVTINGTMVDNGFGGTEFSLVDWNPTTVGAPPAAITLVAGTDSITLTSPGMTFTQLVEDLDGVVILDFGGGIAETVLNLELDPIGAFSIIVTVQC